MRASFSIPPAPASSGIPPELLPAQQERVQGQAL